MKKLKELNTKIAVVLIIVFAFAASLQAQDWNLQSITQASQDYKPEMVLGPDGTPHFVFVNISTNGYYYCKWNGMAWDIELVYTNQSPGNESIPALAVNDDNIPFMYFREKNSSKPTYGGNIAYRDPSQGWVITTYPVFEETNVLSIYNYRILLHENETTQITEPLVVMSGSSKGYFFKYNSLTSEWAVEELGPYVNSIHDAKITTSGNIYFTFRYSNSLNFAHYDGSIWSFLEVDAFNSYSSYNEFSSIDFDNAGQPHISYYDPDDKCLKYARLGQNIQ